MKKLKWHRELERFLRKATDDGVTQFEFTWDTYYSAGELQVRGGDFCKDLKLPSRPDFSDDDEFLYWLVDKGVQKAHLDDSRSDVDLKGVGPISSYHAAFVTTKAKKEARRLAKMLDSPLELQRTVAYGSDYGQRRTAFLFPPFRTYRGARNDLSLIYEHIRFATDVEREGGELPEVLEEDDEPFILLALNEIGWFEVVAIGANNKPVLINSTYLGA